MKNKSTVLEAIRKLGHTVSAADVAAQTGLSLFDTRIALNKIALDTKAVLEVSPRGDISYRFFPDLESIYKLVGLKKLLSQILHIVYEVGFFIVRVSFGVLLIASIITILVVFLVALIFIMCGIEATEAADGGDLDLGGLDFDFFDWEEIGTFFAWSTFARAQTPTTNPNAYYLGISPDTMDKGFFQNCFSFLFGEGNPNEKLEESQWHYVAELIRRNGGVVTSEQLAPYMVNLKTDSRAMLATMVRFDGMPEVTPMGNLVYVFPSLQVTASGISSLEQLPEQIKESEWQFSKVPTERLHWVFFFAGANLCGAYALNQHLSWFKPLIPFTDQVHWMLVYALFFMGFPIVRELSNSVRNAFVETRNKIRAKSSQALRNENIKFKINEAKQFATQIFNVATQAPVYTTGQDILSQDTDGLAQKFEGLTAFGSAIPAGAVPHTIINTASTTVPASPQDVGGSQPR